MRSRHAVVALTYYAPYVSGLTEYARLVAEGLVTRGWRVTVVTTRHRPELRTRETIAGVDVIRTPVVARIGKGALSPRFPVVVAQAARRADVLHIHMPMLEAGLIAAVARDVPLVSTYHCDVALSSGLIDRLQVLAIDTSSRFALRRSHRIGVTTLDYARSSRVARAMGQRAREVGAPCRDQSGGSPRFRDGAGLHVGFLGRVVEEKGIEYLVDGFRAIPDETARLLIAGEFDDVAGGSVIDQVRRHIGDDPRVRVLGPMAEHELPDFYASIDVLALPSINSLEAFGMVQVEALLLGLPVVAGDIPGVRIPSRRVGAGRLVPPRDPAAITRALIDIAAQPGDRAAIAARAREIYGLERVVDAYANLLEDSVTAARRSASTAASTRRREEEAPVPDDREARVEHPRTVDRLAATWEEHGRDDPLWAIMSEGKRRRSWDVGDFFATGRAEIAELISRFRRMGLRPQGRALDFGCGVGRLTEALADHYDRVDGVDVSQSMVRAAEEHTTHAGIAHYHVNVAEDLRLFEGEVFDLVHSQIVLQHVGRELARAYLKEFVRVLRPGGVLHFQLPTTPRWTASGVILRCVPERFINRFRKMRMQGIPERRVRALIRDLGLEPLDVGADVAAGPRWNSRHYTARKSR